MPRKDRESRLAYNREHYAKNSECAKERGKAWYWANREKAREAGRKWRAANKDDPERLRLASKAWRKAHPARCLLASAKHRAKRRGIEFSITEADIQIPDRCPVLGIKITVGSGASIPENSASIDRIDNRFGYVKGNVLVVSWRANRLKGDASPEELQALAAFYGGRRADRAG